MNNILKLLKRYEDKISTLMGFVIILVVGLLVINYFNIAEVEITNDYEETITNPTVDNTIRCLDGRHVKRAEFYESGAIKSVDCTD